MFISLNEMEMKPKSPADVENAKLVDAIKLVSDVAMTNSRELLAVRDRITEAEQAAFDAGYKGDHPDLAQMIRDLSHEFRAYKKALSEPMRPGSDTIEWSACLRWYQENVKRIVTYGR